MIAEHTGADVEGGVIMDLQNPIHTSSITSAELPGAMLMLRTFENTSLELGANTRRATNEAFTPMSTLRVGRAPPKRGVACGGTPLIEGHHVNQVVKKSTNR